MILTSEQFMTLVTEGEIDTTDLDPISPDFVPLDIPDDVPPKRILLTVELDGALLKLTRDFPYPVGRVIRGGTVTSIVCAPELLEILVEGPTSGVGRLTCFVSSDPDFRQPMAGKDVTITIQQARVRFTES